MWKVELSPTNEFKFNYNGVFVNLGDIILFYYKCDNKINYIKIHKSGNIIEKNNFSYNGKIDIPVYWILSKQKKSSYLLFNSHTGIDLNSQKVISGLNIKYDNEQKMLDLSEGQYYFNECYIEHVGAFGYKCCNTISGNKMWQITLNGYLYTDVFQYGDSFIFCTAQHGGGIYAVNVQTGKIKFCINTKGTAKYIKINNILYCYQLGRKGFLLKVDLDNGVIIDSFEIGETTIDSPLQLIDSTYILTVTFCKNKGNFYIPTIECFNINE